MQESIDAQNAPKFWGQLVCKPLETLLGPLGFAWGTAGRYTPTPNPTYDGGRVYYAFLGILEIRILGS